MKDSLILGATRTLAMLSNHMPKAQTTTVDKFVNNRPPIGIFNGRKWATECGAKQTARYQRQGLHNATVNGFQVIQRA